MEREKLLQNPLPIDRVAARVTRAAKAVDMWEPKPKHKEHFVESREVLRTAPLPKTAPQELLSLCGMKRGRITLIGYAADQGSKNQAAKWVVRCDCGNYEHRTRILRWLGTECDDMCRECQKRTFKIRGQWNTPKNPPRSREFVDAFGSIAKNSETNSKA